jgi:hypothetical protein
MSDPSVTDVDVRPNDMQGTIVDGFNKHFQPLIGVGHGR